MPNRQGKEAQWQRDRDKTELLEQELRNCSLMPPSRDITVILPQAMEEQVRALIAPPRRRIDWQNARISALHHNLSAENSQITSLQKENQGLFRDIQDCLHPMVSSSSERSESEPTSDPDTVVTVPGVTLNLSKCRQNISGCISHRRLDDVETA